MNDLLIYGAGMSAGAAAGVVVWWALRRMPQPATASPVRANADASVSSSRSMATQRSAAPSRSAMKAPTGPKPTGVSEPSRSAAPARDGSDFAASALVAGATNSAAVGYLVGGSLAEALPGDALRPDTKEAAVPAEDSLRRSSDGGWIDTGTSCAFESSSADSGCGSGGGD